MLYGQRAKISRRRKRKSSEVNDVRSSNPSVRGMEGRKGIRSKGGYWLPSKEGFGNPYRTFASASSKPDSTILPSTTSSIKKFQRFHDLPVTGVIDKATRRKMRKTNTRSDRSAYSYRKGSGRAD